MGLPANPEHARLLAQLDTAKTALVMASSIDEVKGIRDKAESIRSYYRQQRDSLDIQNHAAKLKLRAERRLGEMLSETELHEGGRPGNQSHDVTGFEPPRLSDLGIEKMQSSRWQKIAELPEEVFEQEISDAQSEGEELTTAHMLRVAQNVGQRIEREARFAAKVENDLPDDDIALFADFSPQLYSVWNFPALTNRHTVFGSIPQEIIDNLLYYYTQPHDVVYDPFGGGGATIDKCMERKRQAFVYDLTPARSDIQPHDITTGLPDGLPTPNLVFLDPPYWKQAAGKYSDKDSDLGNVGLDEFLDTMATIAIACRDMWRADSGILALICGPCKEAGKYIDLPFLCYERINQHLTLKQRIVVPYSTQVHGGAYVQMAKDRKEILYLARDLMIFEAS